MKTTFLSGPGLGFAFTDVTGDDALNSLKHDHGSGEA